MNEKSKTNQREFYKEKQNKEKKNILYYKNINKKIIFTLNNNKKSNIWI